MKSNLFIAGACKSGTSFLHEFLGQQKDICASKPKEPYFFELQENKRDEKEYIEKYFKEYNSEKYLLDGRHRNMFFSWIPQAIHSYNKDSKIIFILRNPVERAYSHWWMWYSRSIIKKKFYDCIQSEINRISKEGLQMDFTPQEYANHIKNVAPMGRSAYADATTIVESGYYYTQIDRFKVFFDANQLLIIDYKEIANPDTLSKKLEFFLGIDFKPNKLNTEVNKAPEFAKVKLSLGKYFPKKIKRFIKNNFFKKRKIEERAIVLLKEHYNKENKKLYKELGVDFAKNWI